MRTQSPGRTPPRCPLTKTVVRPDAARHVASSRTDVTSTSSRVRSGRANNCNGSKGGRAHAKRPGNETRADRRRAAVLLRREHRLIRRKERPAAVVPSRPAGRHGNQQGPNCQALPSLSPQHPPYRPSRHTAEPPPVQRDCRVAISHHAGAHRDQYHDQGPVLHVGQSAAICACWHRIVAARKGTVASGDSRARLGGRPAERYSITLKRYYLREDRRPC